MSKAIVKTLHPNAEAVKDEQGWWHILDGEQQLGDLRAFTAAQAWHYASAHLRGVDYDRWFEACRSPNPKFQRY